jgi:DNA-binding transcriptional regulator PaaX
LKLDKRDNVSICKFLIINIPEKERINRDIMRIYLQNNGFGRLHNTTWINLHCDEKNLLKTLNDLGIENKTLHFSINIDDNNLNKIISYSNWNYKTINCEYNKFIDNVKSFIKNKETNKITARCLVYEYSKIVQKDPIVPNKFLPESYLGKTANNYYIKIRDYCY